jgi:hypothetical protein
MPLFLLKAWGWWSIKAQPWLRKNWMWVLLFPLALLAYLFGKDRGKVVVVDQRQESDAASELAAKVEEKKQQAIAELDRKRAEKAEQVVAEHVETINTLTTQQKVEADKLLDDPGALQDYLEKVGRRAHGATD